LAHCARESEIELDDADARATKNSPPHATTSASTTLARARACWCERRRMASGGADARAVGEYAAREMALEEVVGFGVVLAATRTQGCRIAGFGHESAWKSDATVVSTISSESESRLIEITSLSAGRSWRGGALDHDDRIANHVRRCLTAAVRHDPHR